MRQNAEGAEGRRRTQSRPAEWNAKLAKNSKGAKKQDGRCDSDVDRHPLPRRGIRM